MFGKKKTKAENIQEETYDPYLLEQIQPSGGITFQDSRYVETGTGYETCIHVYDFPQKLDDFWILLQRADVIGCITKLLEL